MTSRIELRKEQQREVSANTPSIGWVAGEAVVDVGDRHADLMPPSRQLAVVDDGFSVRAYREDSTPENIAPTAEVTTTTGLTIGPRNPKQYWRNVGTDTTPTFMEFTSASDISDVYVSLETGTRPLVTRTITVISPTEYEISDGEVTPTWTEPVSIRSFDPRTAKAIGVYSSRGDADRVVHILRNINPNREYGSLSLVDTYNLNLHKRSSNAKEFGGRESGIPHFGSYDIDGEWVVILFSLSGRRMISAQITGWQPANVERKQGTPPFEGEGQLIAPVDMSVQFIDADGDVVETKTETISEDTPDLHTLHVQRTSATTTPSIKVSVGTDGEHNAWLRSFTIPLPRQFSNASTDTYTLSRAIEGDGEGADDTPIQLFGHAKAINVPSIATLGGTRPNEFLTYSGAWDGTSFKALRCRCPAWILHDVLTSEKWGIELLATRINAQSFLEASKHCQELVGSGPRWVFDGPLQGTQTQVIEALLRLMRGWLHTGSDGRYQLRVEKPQLSDWLICPAITSRGRISYRKSLPRPAVRAAFIDRLTGVESTTAGLDTARVETVPWQDPAVAQRWADWETFSQQQLLDTVEFVLPWSHHAIAPGDLVSVHDPLHARIRAAGRVLGSGATWVQLDGPPLGYWPDLVAEAPLRQQNGRQVIDPSEWGYVSIKPIGVTIQVQDDGGGFSTHAVTEIAWFPGGRPEQNRVYLAGSFSIPEGRPVWAINVSIKPTQWRVQSITEGAGGREFSVVATRWIPGMHAHIETGAPLPVTVTQWAPPCGPNLGRFRGNWDDLNERYPVAGAGPFDSGGTFDDLTNSCVS